MSDETTEPAEDEPLVFDLDDPSVPQTPGSAIINLPRHLRRRADGELDPNHLVGKELAGRYMIEREIGRGGMGVVYLARQENLDRKVVVKVLSRQMVGDEEARKRFDREARGMSQLEHPNLVTIYDYGSHEGLSYIVMEYVDGELLTDVLRRRERFFWKDFARIAVQILDAVAEAHEAGVVHRDLKPNNVMLCSRHGQDDFVKILDFGLARFRSNKEITKELFGSVAYLSPEIVKGEKVDVRADVYSLGVMFYELLSGKRPFDGEEDYAVMYKHVNDEPPPLEEQLPFDHLVPEPTIRLIQRCMAKNPAERPKDARELLHLLTSDVSRWTGILPFDVLEGGVPPRYRQAAEEATESLERLRTAPLEAVTAETPRDEAASEPPRPTSPQPAAPEPAAAQPAPPSARSGVAPSVLVVAVLLSLVGGGFIVTSLKTQPPDASATVSETDAPELDVTASLATVNELIVAKKFGRANALLDTLQPHVAVDPELAARAADFRDVIAIEQLIVAAEAARLDGNLDEAKDLYRQVLMRDPNNQVVVAKLSALQVEGDADGAASPNTQREAKRTERAPAEPSKREPASTKAEARAAKVPKVTADAEKVERAEPTVTSVPSVPVKPEKKADTDVPEKKASPAKNVEKEPVEMEREEKPNAEPKRDGDEPLITGGRVFIPEEPENLPEESEESAALSEPAERAEGQPAEDQPAESSANEELRRTVEALLPTDTEEPASSDALEEVPASQPEIIVEGAGE